MCLVVLAFRVHHAYPLIVAGNRDEFHSRPARDADWWPDQPDIFGGRDLQAGGTWLALHRHGRFATVTNYRSAVRRDPKLRSRGHLVTDFLESDRAPLDFLQTVDGAAYAGFNLLASDGRQLAYLSNRGGQARELQPGVYGLSNATLDTPSYKVERSKARLEELVRNEACNETELMRLLADREKGPADEVSGDHLPFAIAHAITAPFVVLPDYGTRCSTIVRAERNGEWSFLERRFDAEGRSTGDTRVSVGGAVTR